MFDKNYMEQKVLWKQANPDAMFTDAVQYKIAQDAAVLTERSFIPIDDAGVALSDQITNENEFDETAALLAEEAAAEAAAAAIIAASQSNGGGTTLTTDEMLNQIEGGN